MQLAGHTALVTGGTQGVGAAIALRLAKSGANVWIHGLTEDPSALSTRDACRGFGVQAELVCCDLSQPLNTWLPNLAPDQLTALGPVDLLVNNAGIFIDRPYLQMDHATWEKTWRVNVEVGFFLTQAYAKDWISRSTRGRVLFTGSINGLLAEPDHAAYDTSKAAVAGMVRTLCVSLAPHGIRVNSMAPGLVRTPLTNQVLDSHPTALAWMELHTPSGVVPDASACAGTAAFLLSDDADHIHGQTIYVDGGMSIWQQPDSPE